MGSDTFKYVCRSSSVLVAAGVGLVVGFLLRHLAHLQAFRSADSLKGSVEPIHPSAGSDLSVGDAKSGTSLDVMLGIVNVIDQIELSKAHVGTDTLGILTGIQASLRDQVELAGGEVIQETVWNPAVQRAVKVEPAPVGQAEPLFLRSLSTGLKYRSRILRKQEVAISQPSQPP